MKKILIALLMCIINVVSYGQLNVVNSGGNTKTDKIVGDMYARVICQNSIYQLSVKDNKSSNHIVITLGNNKEDAVKSLEQLYEWLSTARKKDYFTIDEKGQNIVFYKHDSTAFCVSHGDVEFCKEFIKSQLLSLTIGGYYGQNNIKNPMIGFAKISLIKKALKTLSN